MNVNLASSKLVLNVKYLLLSILFHNLGRINSKDTFFSDVYYFQI